MQGIQRNWKLHVWTFYSLIHKITLKTLGIGYKIQDNAYYDINFVTQITYILFTVFKTVYTCMSDYKQKHINVYALFRKEFERQTHRNPRDGTTRDEYGLGTDRLFYFRFLDNVAFCIWCNSYFIFIYLSTQLP